MPCEAPARCAACAARDLALCGGIPERDLAALHALGRRRVLVPGQALTWAGDSASLCGNVVSGVLKVERQEAGGRAQIVGLLFPGDFAGDPFAPHAAETIVALAATDVCIYPREALVRMLEAHPAAGRLLLQRTLATLAEARRSLPMLAHAPADARVAAFLLDMERRAKVPAGQPFALPLSRGAIAEALGLAIETVSRQITAFRDEGILALSGLRGVHIIDRQALARRAR